MPQLLTEVEKEAEKEVEVEQKSKLSFAMDQIATDRTLASQPDMEPGGGSTVREDAQAINVQDEKIMPKDLNQSMTQGTKSHIQSIVAGEGHKREMQTERHAVAGLTWRHQWLAKKMTSAEEKKQR